MAVEIGWVLIENCVSARFDGILWQIHLAGSLVRQASLMMVILGILAMAHITLQDPVVFAAVEDWLKVVAPHLVLTGCIEAMKTALSSGHPVVALACKRCSRQHLDQSRVCQLEGILHTCVLAVATSGISYHKSKVTL